MGNMRFLNLYVLCLISTLVAFTKCLPTQSGRPEKPLSCDNSFRFQRLDCGYSGISETICNDRGCCFDSSHDDANNCFYSNKRDSISQISSIDCDGSNCEAKATLTLGLLYNNPKDTIPNSASAFGTHAKAYANEYGIGAEVQAHLANQQSKFADGVDLKVKVGQVGAKATFGLEEGIGIGVDATLAEAAFHAKVDKPFFGWVGIGGQVGLSAKTEFKIGPEASVKILGTGVSLGLEKGAEMCLFGSCFWIG